MDKKRDEDKKQGEKSLQTETGRETENTGEVKQWVYAVQVSNNLWNLKS